MNSVSAVFENDMVKKLIKYAIEGAAVAVAMHLIARGRVNIQEILMVALSAAAMFLLLDTFAPSVGSGARLGAGFGLGGQVVGWPAGAVAANIPVAPVVMPAPAPAPVAAGESMMY